MNVDKLDRLAKKFQAFIRSSKTGLDDTLMKFWSEITGMREPFDLNVDADMAKFVFANGRGMHMCTSTRRFHRPKRTGKPVSVTIVLGAFKKEMNDPENQLIPCDRAGRIDCCYFGMAEEEKELGLFFVKQLVKLKAKKLKRLERKAVIRPRHPQ